MLSLPGNEVACGGGKKKVDLCHREVGDGGGGGWRRWRKGVREWEGVECKGHKDTQHSLAFSTGSLALRMIGRQ